MLSRNFNYNQGMQPFNYNHYPMMMGQMNNFMNSPNQAINSNNMEIENSSKNISLNFIYDGHKITIQANKNMKIDRIIKNFRLKLCIDDFSGDYFFRERKIDRDSQETIGNFGISNEDYIYVFDQNDKNQKEKISKMLSHKHDIITIILNASTGNRTKIDVIYYTKISKVLKLYCKKIGLGKAAIGKEIIFLYNKAKLEINDNRTIEEISGGKNNIEIIVYDLGGVLGA